MLDVEREIASLGARARDGALSLEDMTGGTFTISNGGVFGSLMGTPILNTPQAGILGMHATKDRAVVVNGKVRFPHVGLSLDRSMEIDESDRHTHLPPTHPYACSVGGSTAHDVPCPDLRPSHH